MIVVVLGVRKMGGEGFLYTGLVTGILRVALPDISIGVAPVEVAKNPSLNCSWDYIG